MELFKIIKKPIITEKTQALELTWVYTMQVNPLCNKVEIKSAFETLYWVNVEKVNIVKTREKFRNTRKGIALRKKPTTKALISLKAWQRIQDLMKLKIKD